MSSLHPLFPDALPAQQCAFVGMVHLRPLPGSPGWDGDMARIRRAARLDAEQLIRGGCDAIIVENMGDVPYLRGSVDPATVAAAAICVAEVVMLGVPVGVQILAAANAEALGVAVAAGARFIRAEAFAYAHVADEGWLDATAGPLLRQRRALGAKVAVWADVQKKHAAHAVTADVPLADIARGTVFCGADALVVTGTETGRPTDPAHVREARRAGCPVAVGSGVHPGNAADLAAVADALIVGSFLKQDGDWRRAVDLERVRAVRAAVNRCTAS